VKPKIAITCGEPAGIGPDIISRINPGKFEARLIVIGDRSLLEARAQILQSSIDYVDYSPESDVTNGVEVIHQPLARPATPGKLDSANSAAVLQTLDRACHGCLNGEFDAMVTAPVHKEIINRGGIPFSGHTEYLAALCHARPLMLLIADQLRVALVTTHLPLREVADAISAELITNIISILDRDLTERFGLDNPHIKVCRLNPHAGENGYLGREEIDIIIPALQALKASGVNLSGPYPADTVFTSAGLADADAVVAMYHDQGLIPLKVLAFGQCVNITVGLPIIRTSVDHGTAYDIVGKNKADPSSLLEALSLAAKLCS